MIEGFVPTYVGKIIWGCKMGSGLLFCPHVQGEDYRLMQVDMYNLETFPDGGEGGKADGALPGGVFFLPGRG